MSLQTINTFGYEIPRIVANTLLGVPDDTFAVPVSLQTIPFFAIKNGDLWRWNTVTFIWEQVIGGGAGNTIYSANDSLAGDRTVSLSGFFLNVDSPLGTNLGVAEAQSYIAARDGTAGGNIGIVTTSVSGISGNVNLSAFFDGVAQQAIIQLNALSGGSIIEYTAGAHNFDGLMTLDSLAGSGSGIVAVDNAGLLSFMAAPAAGANAALSNLSAVAINTSLISDANNTDDLGSAANAWKDVYIRRLLLDGATSGTAEIIADALANALNATNLTGTGYIQVWHEARETGDFTGQNVNTVQPMFSPGNDVFAVQASTAYDFEIFLSLNHGAVSHSIGISFELAGGASITSITYLSMCWVTAIGTNTASQTTNLIQVATNTAINAAGANATEQIFLKGTINVNAGGTITPSYTCSSAPGGTVLTKAGSSIKIAAKGTNVFTSIGPFS
jgi:hypothetical protein